MKLEDIQSEWAKDAKPDRSNLDSESLNIPYLHQKYYKIYMNEKFQLQNLEDKFNELRKLKWEYYQGKLDYHDIKDLGWQQLDKKVLRSDIEIYLQADKDLIEKNLVVLLQREKVKFLESILKTISNRSFAIRNAIEFIKFSTGL